MLYAQGHREISELACRQLSGPRLETMDDENATRIRDDLTSRTVNVYGDPLQRATETSVYDIAGHGRRIRLGTKAMW